MTLTRRKGKLGGLSSCLKEEVMVWVFNLELKLWGREKGFDQAAHHDQGGQVAAPKGFPNCWSHVKAQASGLGKPTFGATP